MAERMVTRTITSATVACMTADLSTMKMEIVRFPFSANLTDADIILKCVKDQYETDTFKILSVTMDTIEKESALYGMTETDFLRYAKRMESRFKMENEA